MSCYAFDPGILGKSFFVLRLGNSSHYARGLTGIWRQQPGDVAMILFKILLKPLLSLRYPVRVLGLEHVQLGFASNRKA